MRFFHFSGLLLALGAIGISNVAADSLDRIGREYTAADSLKLRSHPQDYNPPAAAPMTDAIPANRRLLKKRNPVNIEVETDEIKSTTLPNQAMVASQMNAATAVFIWCGTSKLVVGHISSIIIGKIKAGEQERDHKMKKAKLSLKFSQQLAGVPAVTKVMIRSPDKNQADEFEEVLKWARVGVTPEVELYAYTNDWSRRNDEFRFEATLGVVGHIIENLTPHPASPGSERR